MKTTRSTPKTPTLDTVLSERYGVTLMTADALTVEWAAEHLATLTDAFTAGQAWRKADAKRHRMGLYTTMPTWTHPLYDARVSKTREGYDAAVARRAGIVA